MAPVVPKKEPVDRLTTAASGSNPPQRLQSLSQRSGTGLGGGAGGTGVSTRGRFAPKVVARRTKEERDSTAPQEKAEVKPIVPAGMRGRGGSGPGGRGGISGRGRGRGRFEPVVSAAIGPLAAPTGVDPRGSRFSSPAIGVGAGVGTSRTSPFGADLASMVGRVKSETPGVSSGYSSRATSVEVEENRIDMTQNTYVDGALSEYFPVRLDRRGEDDGEAEEEEAGEGKETEIKVKTEPTDDNVPSALVEKPKKKKSSDADSRTKRSEAAIFQEEQLRELSRMTHDHKVIAKEFNMEGRHSKTAAEGEASSELDGLEEIEKRLYFFQFPLLMPQFTTPPISKEEKVPELSGSSEDDDDIMVVDEKVKQPAQAVAPAAAAATPAATAPLPQSSVTEDGLPEGLIGKLRLHRSGKLTMVVGNITMEVSQGTECSFLQDVVVMEPEGNNAYLIGQVSKKMVLSPELDDESLL